MMKQKYFLILGIMSIVGIILISGYIQQGKTPSEGWSKDSKLLIDTGATIDTKEDMSKGQNFITSPHAHPFAKQPSMIEDLESPIFVHLSSIPGASALLPRMLL